MYVHLLTGYLHILDSTLHNTESDRNVAHTPLMYALQPRWIHKRVSETSSQPNTAVPGNNKKQFCAISVYVDFIGRESKLQFEDELNLNQFESSGQ